MELGKRFICFSTWKAILKDRSMKNITPSHSVIYPQNFGGEIGIFQRVLSGGGEVTFQSAWGGRVLVRNLNFQISAWGGKSDF